MRYFTAAKYKAVYIENSIWEVKAMRDLTQRLNKFADNKNLP